MYNIKLKQFGFVLGILSSLCWTYSVTGQDSRDFKFKKLGTQNGLADASVGSTYQDRYGLIWIATRNGVNLYDGDQMTHYGLPHGLANGHVYDVKGSNDDSLIWIGTKGGLSVLDRFTDTLQNIELKSGQQPSITKISVWKDREVCLSSNDGLWVGHLAGWQQFIPDSTNQYAITDSYAVSHWLSDTAAIIGTDNGINIYNKSSGQFAHVNNDPEVYAPYNYMIQSLFQRKNGELWIGAYDFEKYGAMLIQTNWPNSWVYHVHNPEDPNSLLYNYSVLSIYEDQNDRVWIGSNGGGLSFFNDQDSTFINLTHDPTNKNGLSDQDVWHIKEDREGLLWVGTDGGGINLYHPIYNRFEAFANNPFDKTTINTNQILTIEDDDTVTWFGTNGASGLARRSKKTGRFYNYPFTDDLTESLFDNTVYDLEKVGKYLWVASYAGALSRLNIENGTFKHYSTTENFVSDYVSTIVRVGDFFYLGSGKGLTGFDLQTEKAEFFDDPQREEEIMIHHMARKGDTLWVGSDAGIQWFSLNTRSFLEVPKKPVLKRHITYIHHTDHHTWLGTPDGLYLVTDDLEEIRVEGLSDQYIQGIVSDESGRLWVTTKKGLNLVNPSSDRVASFYAVDGLHGDFFNHRSIHRGANGLLYAGGNAGFSMFDPDQIELQQRVVKPSFSTIRIMEGDSSYSHHLLGQESIELSYEQATFALDFFVADYVFPEKLRFKYRLKGLSDQFFDLENNSEINITDLSAGRYTLELFSTNADGVWLNEPTVLEIKVGSPFWLSWYAFIFYGSLILGVFVVRDRYIKAEKIRLEQIVSDRTNEIRKQKELAEKDKHIIEEQSKKLQELDKVKTRFFSNISHEFRTPLTLIKGPLESILTGKVQGNPDLEKNLKVASRNADTLRNLIDEILEFNKLDIGELKINYIPVNVKDYFEELAGGYELVANEQHVNWEAFIQLSEDLRLDLPEGQLQKIIHNLVSNALKHSKSGQRIRLFVNYQGQTLKVSVEDQAGGIPASEQESIFERFYQSSHGKLLPHSSGIGLAYVKEISEVIGGEITLNSEFGKGSTFSFSIEAKEVVAGLAPATQVEEEEVPELNAGLYPHPNNKILIAEDNSEMADYIAQVLGQQFEVRRVNNGEEALAILEEFNPDLIISDIMMPVMDGLEFLEQIKSHDKWRYKSVLILTAKSSHEVKIEALMFGIDDYLTKPFSPLELEIRVKNILTHQHERKTLSAEGSDEPVGVEDPLISQLVDVIEENIDNRQFGVMDLSAAAALSDRQLTRVIKKSIGLTPASLIREVKLQKAKNYLEQKRFRSVNEVCYAVGFEKVSYFSRKYFERFGKKPSEYLN